MHECRNWYKCYWLTALYLVYVYTILKSAPSDTTVTLRTQKAELTVNIPAYDEIVVTYITWLYHPSENFAIENISLWCASYDISLFYEISLDCRILYHCSYLWLERKICKITLFLLRPVFWKKASTFRTVPTLLQTDVWITAIIEVMQLRIEIISLEFLGEQIKCSRHLARNDRSNYVQQVLKCPICQMMNEHETHQQVH